MDQNTQTKAKIKAQDLFLKHKGYLRASEALANGIQPRDLYALRNAGLVEPVSRGLFRLKSMPALESPNLFIISVKLPDAVLCLQSALAFHHLITQAPQKISVALIKGSDKPKIKNLPVNYFLISEPAFSEGIQVHEKNGVPLRVYSPEKTLADCFKFRNKIGLAICLEALQTWWKRENKDLDQLLNYAKICRTEKIMRPYHDLLVTQK